MGSELSGAGDHALLAPGRTENVQSGITRIETVETTEASQYCLLLITLLIVHLLIFKGKNGLFFFFF